MNKAKFLLSGFFLSICLLSAPWQALAQEGKNCPSGTVCITNPLSVGSFQELIGVVINNIMGIIGSIALVMFIAGGLIWLTSGGNATKVKQGKDIIIWAALGLALIFSSYALVRFVIELAK